MAEEESTNDRLKTKQDAESDRREEECSRWNEEFLELQRSDDQHQIELPIDPMYTERMRKETEHGFEELVLLPTLDEGIEIDQSQEDIVEYDSDAADVVSENDDDEDSDKEYQP